MRLSTFCFSHCWLFNQQEFQKSFLKVHKTFKFDKGTIYIVYFHTHVHVHIEKMGNLSKSKLKLYICDNKRSCAQFAPRGNSAPGC